VEDKLIIVDSEPQTEYSLLQQYYLGLRAAMFICEDTCEDENEAQNALKMWRESSLKEAYGYLWHHVKLGKVLSPDFMWIINSATIEELKDKYPDVVNIQLKFSMKPRLSARVIDKNTIIFPALSRVILNHYNLVIINAIYSLLNEEGELSEEKILKESDNIKKNTVRFMLPYLLFCHDDFSVANLPLIGAYSKNAFIEAMHLAKLQLIFIFAHEYAHIVLKHFENTEMNSDTKILMESEADNLALKVVMGYVEKDNSYSKLDVFTAIRWLLKYQLLEENVGILVRGKKLEPYESMFEERRDKLQNELFDNYALRGSSMFEMMGFVMLVDLQGILYGFEPEFINFIIEKLKIR